MQIFPITNYTVFYGKPIPEDPFASIRQYPTDVVLLFLCKANAALFQIDQSILENRLYILNEVFHSLSQAKRARIRNLILQTQKEDEHKYSILLNKQSLAWLIAQCFSFYKPMNDSQSASEMEVHENVFDAILIANELYYNTSGKFEIGSYEHIWEIMLRQQNYVQDLTSMVQNGSLKMMFFLKFIKHQFSEGNQWVEEFCSNLGIQNYFTYSDFFMDLLKKVFEEHRVDGKIRWQIESNPESKILIDRFAHRPADLSNPDSTETLHGGLIPKPIYFAMDQYAIIIDFNFLGWIIETALPYNFYSYTSMNKIEKMSDFSSFKGILGKAFYEEFIGQKLIKRIFSNSICLYGEEINSITDQMIICEKDIYVFEFKSASLNYRVLDQLDIKGFKSFIDKTFLADKKFDGKNRGVFQLKRCIDKVAEGNIPSVTSKLKKGLKYDVYPIIVYIDPVLENHGVNAYCNETFLKEIEKFKPSFRHIYPLTMINLNFFLLNYNKLCSKASLIKKYIKEYHKRIASDKKSFKRSGIPLLSLKASISFDNYIKKHLSRDVDSIRRVANDFDLPR